MTAKLKPTYPMLLLFSLPALMQGFMHSPVGGVIQGVYARNTGLELAAIGTAILIAKIFDAVTDPIIGIWSDARFGSSGSRKPFIVAGTAITMIGLWFLFRPPEDPSMIYFLGWFMVSYLGWTITEIPYRAWGYELTSDYVWRTRVQVFMSLALWLGSMAFYAVPILLSAVGLTETTEINMETLRYAAIIIVFLMPLLNLIAVWRVPNGNRLDRKHDRALTRAEAWTAIKDNKPLLYILAGLVLAGLSGGLAANIMFLYFSSYMGLAEQFALISLLVIPASLLGIPFWGLVCQRYERKYVWALSNLAAGFLYPLFALVPPGEGAFVPVTAAITLVTFLGSSTYVAGVALLGDVVDYGKWKFGRDYGGFYSSFQTFINKTVAGVAGSLGLIILGWFGFEAAADSQVASAITGMKLVIAWVPAIGTIVVAGIIWKIPITRSDHEQRMRELQALETPAPESASTDSGQLNDNAVAGSNSSGA